MQRQKMLQNHVNLIFAIYFCFTQFTYASKNNWDLDDVELPKYFNYNGMAFKSSNLQI